MSTRTLGRDDEECLVKEEAEGYIMKLVLRPTSAIRHIESKEE